MKGERESRGDECEGVFRKYRRSKAADKGTAQLCGDDHDRHMCSDSRM